MKTIINKIVNYIVCKYYEFLLWLDSISDKKGRYLTPSEVKLIIRQYNLIEDGVNRIKKKVNSLVKSKTKEEYHKILLQISNLIDLSEEEPDSPKTQLIMLLRQIYYDKIDKKCDVETEEDKIEMINTRINHYKELHKHKEKRELIRKIREAKKQNNKELELKLTAEFNEKYGKRK